jgi:hypothetical protein
MRHNANRLEAPTEYSIEVPVHALNFISLFIILLIMVLYSPLPTAIPLKLGYIAFPLPRGASKELDSQGFLRVNRFLVIY